MLAFTGGNTASQTDVCPNPASVQFESITGAGSVSDDCLCVHVSRLDNAGASSVVLGSAWYLAASLATGLRYAPSLLTQLLHDSNVSNGSILVLHQRD